MSQEHLTLCITLDKSVLYTRCFSRRIYKLSLTEKFSASLANRQQLGQFGWIHEIASLEDELYEPI